VSISLCLSSSDNEVVLELDDRTITDELRDALPFESRISTWGEEIYFPVPVEAEAGELTTDVNVGDVAFWHEGQSLAVFFGPTPLSDDDQPVPADDVEVLGTVSKGLDRLDQFHAGSEIDVKLGD